MKKRTVVSLIFLAAAIILLIKTAPGAGRIKSVQPKDEKSDSVLIALHKSFFESEGFYRAVAVAEKSPDSGDIEAIIIPHHLLASDFIADMMKKTSGKKVKQAVIIGPNHENIGVDSIVSVDAVWQTPFGYMETDAELADKFFRDFGLRPNKEAFVKEHSIGAIIPFVKYYFPDAKILPIIFNSYADARDAKKVSSWLANNLNKDSLVIISTDFSHYLTRDEAEKKDAVTRDLVGKKDIDGIMRLDNDNVDSPASLAAGLFYAEEKGLAADFVHHANSFDLAKNKSAATTSYFAVSFSRE